METRWGGPQGDWGWKRLPPPRRTAPLADSSAGTASFSPAPVQPEHQGAGARRHPSFRVYLVPFIPEAVWGRWGVNPRPGEREGENLSLTWSAALGTYSLNPGKPGVWGGRGSCVLAASPLRPLVLSPTRESRRAARTERLCLNARGKGEACFCRFCAWGRWQEPGDFCGRVRGPGYLRGPPRASILVSFVNFAHTKS